MPFLKKLKSQIFGKVPKVPAQCSIAWPSVPTEEPDCTGSLAELPVVPSGEPKPPRPPPPARPPRRSSQSTSEPAVEVIPLEEIPALASVSTPSNDVSPISSEHIWISNFRTTVNYKFDTKNFLKHVISNVQRRIKRWPTTMFQVKLSFVSPPADICNLIPHVHKFTEELTAIVPELQVQNKHCQELPDLTIHVLLLYDAKNVSNKN
jgi:hypothetical protein